MCDAVRGGGVRTRTGRNSRSSCARGDRVAMRQEGSGDALLLSKLVADSWFKLADLQIAGDPVSSEIDIAVAVREGRLTPASPSRPRPESRRPNSSHSGSDSTSRCGMSSILSRPCRVSSPLRRQGISRSRSPERRLSRDQHGRGHVQCLPLGDPTVTIPAPVMSRKKQPERSVLRCIGQEIDPS